MVIPDAPRNLALTVAGLGLAVVLTGPAAYSWATVTTAHAGALPTAGPAGAAVAFGPGGRGGGFPGGFGQGQTGNGFPGGGQGAPGTGAIPGQGGLPGSLPNGNGNATGRNGGFGGGPGGILGSSTPSAELTGLLQADASSYRWVAAVVSANQAAGYQLAANDPVMAIGGFNGTDPAPSLAQFQQYVTNGDIHYFIVGGGGFGGRGRAGGQGQSASVSSQITNWVSNNFTARTVGGTTVYDLTAPAK
jgi:hypothetical protein